MQLEDGAGVSGSVHGGAPGALSPTLPLHTLSAAMWTSPQALPMSRPLTEPPRPTAMLAPAHDSSHLELPAATAAVMSNRHPPQDPPAHTPQRAPQHDPQHDPRMPLDTDRPSSGLTFQTPDGVAVGTQGSSGRTERQEWQPSLDGSGPVGGPVISHLGAVPIGYSANRRKRSSCDSRTGSIDAADAARSAAQLVAATTPRHTAWERGAMSGPLEECMHGSACGSAHSEPLQAPNHAERMTSGVGRGSGGDRSATGVAAAAARRSLLRQRSGGSARLARRSFRVTDPDRASSGSLPEVAAEAQQAATAAALPPLTAMEGRLKPLPKHPTTSQARECGPRLRASRWPYSGLLCESIRESAVEAPCTERDGEPDLPSTAVLGAAFAQLDAPCPDEGQRSAAAAGWHRGFQYADTASRGAPRPQHRPVAQHRPAQPATPFTTPRSPSPQRLCRREETPKVPATAPSQAQRSQHSPPDLGRALGGHGSGGHSPSGGYEGSARPLARPVWMSRVQEDPEESKRQLAVQRFNRELHNRLAAQGLEAGAEEAAPPSVVRPQAGPRSQQPPERRRERQFVDKDRLEESTLSALAALMKR